MAEQEKEREIQAVKNSPWDEVMRGQVWGDRGLLRWRMKKEMAGYKSFLESVGEGPLAVERLHDFCYGITRQDLYEIFQLSRQDLVDLLKTKYKICSFYTIVFCTVAEQLEHFELTGFGVDAPDCQSDSELHFENDLKFDKKGRGFCIDAVTYNKSDDEYTINDSVIRHFLQRMVSLAGPTLLTCPTSDEASNTSSSPSFRSDRRVIRLIITRYWADKLIDKYNEFNSKMG